MVIQTSSSCLCQIIAGARRQHLLSWYHSQFSEGKVSAEKVLDDIGEAMLVCDVIMCDDVISDVTI